jgi:hypothetical protein
MLNNKSLFSEHYLTHRLPEYSDYRDDSAALAARDRLRAIYADKQASLITANEAQTEEDFIKPALDILGWKMIVQAKSRVAGLLRRPDYALFPDLARYEASNRVKDDQEKFWPLVSAIGEAKRWDRPLSARINDPSDNSDPNFQMVRYIRSIHRVQWGILTNGRLWRLYTSNVSSAATQYYEIDLIAALESESLDDFKRFWLFFRAAAYLPDTVTGRFSLSACWMVVWNMPVPLVMNSSNWSLIRSLPTLRADSFNRVSATIRTLPVTRSLSKRTPQHFLSYTNYCFCFTPNLAGCSPSLHPATVR